MNERNRTYINANQIRASRALLDWSQDELAEACGLSIATIRKIEAGHISPRDSTMKTIKVCFENAQIEFTPSSGLRLKDNEISIMEDTDAYLQLLDDIYHTLKDRSGEALFLYADSTLATEAEIAVTLRIKHMGIKWRFLSEEGSTYFHYPLEEYRLLPKKFFKRAVQLIYANKIAMGYEIDKTIHQTTKIVLIESAPLAESNRNLFNFLWDSCRKPTYTTAPKIYE